MCQTNHCHNLYKVSLQGEGSQSCKRNSRKTPLLGKSGGIHPKPEHFVSCHTSLCEKQMHSTTTSMSNGRIPICSLQHKRAITAAVTVSTRWQLVSTDSSEHPVNRKVEKYPAAASCVAYQSLVVMKDGKQLAVR